MANSISSGTVRLVAGANITFQTGAGSTVTISGPNTHAQQTGISAISNSNTTYTSGTVGLSQVGAITIRSTTGNQFQFSVNAQTTQTQNVVDVTLSGNTSGALALVSSGTMTLAGGNNITLSQAGNAVTISGAAAGGAQTGISGLANSETTYTSGSVTLEGTNNITIFSTTGQRFRISGANTHAQQTGISAISNSDTTYTSGTVGLSALANITIRSTTGNQFQFSVGAGGAETQTAISGLKNTETTYTSGTVELEGTNNITVFSTTGQRFRISGANTHAQQTGISALSNSNTTYTSGTVGLSELGAITIRSTTGNQFQFSVNSQTTQTQGVLSAGVSTGGNTAGNTTVNTGSRLVLVGSGNLTASQGTAAGATTVTLSAGTQTVQTQGVLSIGVSTGGNTAGNTTVNTGSRLVLSGQANITLSEATAAGATTIGISGGAGGGGGGIAASISGNSTSAGAGYSNITSGTMILAGGPNVTLSQDGSRISISAPAGGGGGGITHSGYDFYRGEQEVAAAMSQGSIHVWPYHFDRDVQFDRVIGRMNYTQATNSTLTVSVSVRVGLYTRNASTLSLAHSSSGSFSINGSGTASSNQNSGRRNYSFGWTTTIPESDYWMARVISTATGGANATLSEFVISAINSSYSGYFGEGSASTLQAQLGLGEHTSVAFTMLDSMAFSNIRGNQSAYQRPPHIWFLSETV